MGRDEERTAPPLIRADEAAADCLAALTILQRGLDQLGASSPGDLATPDTTRLLAHHSGATARASDAAIALAARSGGLTGLV